MVLALATAAFAVEVTYEGVLVKWGNEAVNLGTDDDPNNVLALRLMR